MQEERDHKGLFGMVRGLIFEDVPDDGPSEPAQNPAAAGPAKPDRKGSDDVDRMFADIEAEAAAKTGRPAPPKGGATGAGPVAQPLKPAAPSAAGAPLPDALPPDVRKIVKMIDALPSVLTQEQVKPLLAAMMDAANLSAETIVLQAEDSTKQAQQGIAAAGQEIARLEADREETLGRLAKLMEAARTQCAEGVAAQQARIAALTSALNTLERVARFMPVSPAQDGTEKKP